MRSTTVSEAQESLPQLLESVRDGETIEIVDSDGAIARLVPASSGTPSETRLEQLIRAGSVRRNGTGIIPREIADTTPPASPHGSILQLLMEDRENGW